MINTICKTFSRIKPHWRPYSSIKILGIESSCDDTSAAVLDDKGNVLGEGHFSQTRIHLETGGVIPQVATNLHREYLKTVVETSMKQSLLDFKDLDVIAVTTRPGLILSLLAGVEYAKDLCCLYKKPLMPIHHMEAHALTGRLVENIEFPFLVLLISGGHCILSLVKSVDKFYTLSSQTDSSPGQVFDKVARRACLKNSKKFRGLAGGAAIEAAALDGDPNAFSFPKRVLPAIRNCSFSFPGLGSQAVNFIKQQEKTYNVGPDELIPGINDLCASLQWAVARHLCQRLEIAMVYLREKKILENKCLVVSGGVASNKFIRKALKYVCDHYGYRMVVPPPKLCTDNGVMIAWNAIERFKENLPVVQPDNLDSVVPIAKCELGENIADDVNSVMTNVKIDYIKYKTFLETFKKSEDCEVQENKKELSVS